MNCLINIKKAKNWFLFKRLWWMGLIVVVCTVIFYTPTRNFVLKICQQAIKKNSNFYLTIITAVYAFFTICIFRANKKSTDLLQMQLDTQKEQWIKNSFMKRECEIIAKGKDLFDQTEPTIYMLEAFFLSMSAFCVISNTNNKQIKNNNYAYYYKNLMPLYEHYKQYQLIFDKYGFKEGFDYLDKYMYLLNTSKNAFEQGLDLQNTRQYKGVDRVLFWYTFPVLVYEYYKKKRRIYNPNYEECYEKLTPEMFDEYKLFLCKAKTAVHSIKAVFDRIMAVDIQSSISTSNKNNQKSFNNANK